MAEVLSPTASPLPSSPSGVNMEMPYEEKVSSLPASQTSAPLLSAHDARPSQPRERIPSYAANRMSVISQRSTRTRSRPQSTLTMNETYPSTLPYAIVRDFAYSSFHPMHHGPPPESQSGTTTPGSEWNSGRRASDSVEGGSSSASRWAGPWGGDGGALYADPDQNPLFDKMDPLPATAFGHYASDDLGDLDPPFRTLHHRKSRSFSNMDDFERGRHRNSLRKTSGDPSSDMFYFSSGTSTNPQHVPQFADPAGRASLRQSRSGMDNATARRDSHFAHHGTHGGTSTTTLPSRSFHTSQSSTTTSHSDLPLDAEYFSRHSAQRESMGPEDEELYAGESLALYGFEPENPNELRLVEGQVVIVSYRHGQGWLVASDPITGEQGLVPEEYVRLVKHIENWDHERGGFIEDHVDEEEDEKDDDDDDDDLADDADDDFDVDIGHEGEQMQRGDGESGGIAVDNDGSGEEAGGVALHRKDGPTHP